MLIGSNCRLEFARMVNDAAERLWFQDVPGDPETPALRQLQAIYVTGLIAVLSHADCMVKIRPAARQQILDLIKRRVNVPLPRSPEEAAKMREERIAVAATLTSLCRSVKPRQ